MIKQFLSVLKTGNKAEFALELLFHKDPQDFAVPDYIDEGLKWLEDQVMAAKRMGFYDMYEPLYRDPSLRIGLLDGTLQGFLTI